VNLLRSADKAHGSQAIAPIVHDILSGFYHGGMIAQAKVVVGAKVHHSLSCAYTYVCALGCGDNAFVLVQTLFLEIFEHGLQIGFHFAKHGNPPFLYFNLSLHYLK
jgi:hypothetical protein